ncbi:HIT zinc finger family protein [Aphelenchoides besseyi]|nr:HIT zinc finger family protein [Aphelenchoides besseyi]
MAQAKAVTKNRQSERLVGLETTRILDESTRKRRVQRQLDALEQDNVQADPHANLSWHKQLPKFDDDMIVGNVRQPKRKPPTNADKSTIVIGTNKGKRLRAELTKSRFRKDFKQMNDEFEKSVPNDFKLPLYSQVVAEPSRIPKRKFCCVCCNFAKYCCGKCGQNFCSVVCNDTHIETRCLKWVN